MRDSAFFSIVYPFLCRWENIMSQGILRYKNQFWKHKFNTLFIFLLIEQMTYQTEERLVEIEKNNINLQIKREKP